jgi:hypothetical protein
MAGYYAVREGNDFDSVDFGVGRHGHLGAIEVVGCAGDKSAAVGVASAVDGSWRVG